MQVSSGSWNIVRHKDDITNDFHLGIAYFDTSPDQNFRNKCLELLYDIKEGKSPEAVKAEWPEPDLEQIKNRIAKFANNGLSIQILDAYDISAVSRNPSWKCINFLSRSLIAQRNGPEEAEIHIHDLADEHFSYTLRTEHGIPVVEADNPNFQPDTKFWDFEVLSALRQSPTRAFDWWEY